MPQIYRHIPPAQRTVPLPTVVSEGVSEGVSEATARTVHRTLGSVEWAARCMEAEADTVMEEWAGCMGAAMEDIQDG